MFLRNAGNHPMTPQHYFAHGADITTLIIYTALVLPVQIIRTYKTAKCLINKNHGTSISIYIEN
jgi:hypothetical protein